MDTYFPQFIRDRVIERLQDGDFVAHRKSAPGSLHLDERRDTVSPLAVVKRCIKYDPKVFDNRKNLILQLAEALNHPKQKVVLVAGEQGSGKTSLVRAVVELLGGGVEQVLWFDVHQHTNVEELIQFLIEYIQHLYTPIDPQEKSQPVSSDPLQHLEKLLLNVSHMPLLVVIDNTEHLVSTDHRIQFQPLKDMLNFLLSFSNIKLILSGERLPIGDMGTHNPAVVKFQLAGLPQQYKDDIKKLIAKKIQQPLDPTLFSKIPGAPWLVRILLYLAKHMENPAEALSQLNKTLLTSTMSPPETLMRFIYQQLSPEEQALAQVMAFLRHPADITTLGILVKRTQHKSLPPLETLQHQLEHSPLRAVLKRTFPPQEVLEHIQHRHQPVKSFQPWFELYQAFKKVIYEDLPEQERHPIHQQLQAFYLNEKNKSAAQRQLKTHTQALIAEAKHHGQASRRRRAGRTENYPSSTAFLIEKEPSLEATSYFSQETSPAIEASRWTLADFQHLEHRDIDNAQTPDWLTSDQTYTDPWPDDAIRLTDEEKALLLAPQGNPYEHPKESRGFPTKRPSKTFDSDIPHTSSLSESDPVEQDVQDQLAKSVANQNKSEFCRLLLKLAQHRLAKGDFTEAQHCLKKLITIEADLTESETCQLYSQLGHLYKETYHHNDALSALHKAAELITGTTPTDNITLLSLGNTHFDLGDIYSFRGQHQQAIHHLNQAIAYFQQAEHTDVIAEAHFKLGAAYDDMEDPEKALQHFQTSFTHDKEQGNALSCAATLVNMGTIHRELGHYTEAIEQFKDSLLFDRHAHNLEGQFKTLNLIATTHAENNQWQIAEETHKHALSLALQEKNPTWKAMVYLKLGNLAQQQQRWQQAREYYETAKESVPDDLTAESYQLIDQKIQAVIRQEQATPHEPNPS